MAWLAARIAFIHHVLARLADERQVAHLFATYVRGPLIVVAPMMLASLVMSEASEEYGVDLYHEPADFWLLAYGVMLDVCVVYLLIITMRFLLILRRESRSHVVVDLYLLALAVGAACAVARLAEAVTLPAYAGELINSGGRALGKRGDQRRGNSRRGVVGAQEAAHADTAPATTSSCRRGQPKPASPSRSANAFSPLLVSGSPQGSAGSSPHHISGTVEAMVASTSQFPAGVYQNRLGYQNSSAAVGCSAPRSRIFAPVYIGISIVATLPKSLAHKRITHR
jgi:hypothetical protein